MKTASFRFSRLMVFILIVAATSLFTGCSTVSHGVSNDGRTAKEMVWPQSRLNQNGKGLDGIYATPDTLALLHAGMDKDQVRHLVGPPQFNEGFGAREWNYLVYVSNTDHADDASGYRRCSVKLLFGPHGRVGSIYWRGGACPPTSHATVASKSPVAEEAPAAVQPVSPLVAQVLFQFGKAGIDDLLSASRRRLDQLVADLRAREGQIQHLSVDAYTDRLGEDAINQALSQQRAYNVARYLIQRGITEDHIFATGHGAAVPDARSCPTSLSRKELIACLGPDRRADIRVDWK